MEQQTLDDRKAAVLTAIVRDFIREGEPVGSQRLVDQWALGVSSATVRAEMAALEDAGFITHPHRSAGRVPTDKGYRFFVDTIAKHADIGLGAEQQALLDGLLLEASDLEDLLRRASVILSRLTRFAALVAAPSFQRSRLKHIELVPLGGMVVLAVLIADTGRVEKRMLEVTRPIAEHDVQRARHAVNGAAAGLRVTEAAHAIGGVAAGSPPELVELIESIADAVREGGLEGPASTGRVFVGGSANVVDGNFRRLEEIKRVYETLEEHVIVVQMLQEALEVGDPAVRIGTELPLGDLAACAVVAASYDATGDTGGSVGVLGPTRMDYSRTLAAVQAVAATLEKALASLTGDRQQ